MTDRRITSVKALAKYLGISEDLLYQLVRENKIPHIRLNRRILFVQDVIDKWLIDEMKGGKGNIE